MGKRRIFALLLTLSLLALSACSGPSAAPADTDTADAPVTADDASTTDDAPQGETALTMRDVLDANRGTTIFPVYGSVLKTYQYPDDPDGKRVSEYADAEVVFMDFGSEQDLLSRDGSNGYLRDDEGYAAILEFNLDMSYYDYPAFDEELTLQEEIVRVSEEGDTIVFETRLPMSAFDPYYPEGESPYDEGDYTEEVYVLDASDLRLMEENATLIHADGSREGTETVTVTYGGARPEAIDDLLSHKNASDVRIGTVTLDPGTPEERSASAVAQKGDYISLFLPEGYDDFYDDPECTVLDEGSDEPDLSADFHLYSVRTEE